VCDCRNPGLQQESQVVLQVPVFDDAIVSDVLDVESDEVDRLARPAIPLKVPDGGTERG
jgi:hypothetical protein